MSNQMQKINVEFPKKMEIHSPELDAVSKSTNTLVKILERHLQEIIKPLQTLYELPNLLRQLNETVTHNFKALFQSSVEADVLDRQATLKVIETKTGFVETHITRKKTHASDAINQIQNDYDQYFHELAQEQEFFLQKLDSHAYDLVEKAYPKHIQEKFSFHSLPSLHFLTEHISDSASARTTAINTLLTEAEAQINHFVVARDLFYDKLDNLKIDSQMSIGSYNVPCWAVDIENLISGQTQRKYFFPWNMNEISKETERSIEFAIDQKCITIQSQIENQPQKEVFLKELSGSISLNAEEWNRFINDCKIFIEKE